ncbi:MAG: T9SS type A sorting domain-containing protein [Ignavibacteriales bacterium]|nr:T9SS type A sorting domain-containing protein [Ignavibacteriales bacterium]
MTNESGQQTKSVNLNLGGCPFVYTWNDTVWTEDNNILPQSQDEGRQGSLTDDYYCLYTKPSLTADETYRLAIGEFEQEQSFIDLTKLIIVDHPLETDITVDDSGRVYQFAKPAFFASAQMDTLDVLKMLFAPDSVTVEAEANSKLEMSFQGTSQGTDKWLVLAAHTQAKDLKSGSVRAKNSEAFTDFRLRANQSFVWVPVHQDSLSTVMVDVLWKESSTIDYAELSQKLELPFTVTVPELLSAVHSEEGDVMQKLLVEDGDVMTLSPNQWVTLDFRAPRLAEGMERSFIFASKGYYQLYQNNKANTSGVNDKNIVSEKPKDYALMQNSPNPFNPSTVIQYQLPKDGQVKITLFDILGREVMVLVDDYKTAGSYSYQFNADRLSSGVYIYRMDSGNFHTSKKLTLLK